MALQVPYNPVPQETTGGQLSEVNVRVSEASFGADLSRAIAGMGKTLEGVGDQVFERGLWLQNLNNQAEARKADATYIIESGKLHAEFNSLEGDQALKAYPAYQEKLKSLRSQIRSGLSTRGSQEMYDGQTLGTLSRAIFNGASHVAAAQKKFVSDSAEAQLTAIREQAAADPLNQQGTAEAIRRTEATVRQMGSLRGQPPEAIDNNVRIFTSAIYRAQIEKLSNEDPLAGPAKLKELNAKLTEKDREHATRIVEANNLSYGSAKIATDLISGNMNDDGTLKRPLTELQAEAREKAAAVSPDDPKFASSVVRALDSEYRQQNYARTVQKRQTDQETMKVLLDNPGIKNKFDYLQTAEGYALYKAMTPKQQAGLEKTIHDHITSRDRESNDKMMLQISGMRDRDREQFLNLNPSDPRLKLSAANIARVTEWQRKAMADTEKDPRVARFMTLMRDNYGAELRAIGIYSHTKANEPDYDHFTGALQQALLAWKDDHKRLPTDKEFKDQIAPSLLRVKKESWGEWFWRSPFSDDFSAPSLLPKSQSVFQHDTGSKQYRNFADIARDEAAKQGAVEPSDEEIYRLYSRMIFMQLYKAQKDKASGKR